jgi:hypothetical protein
MNTQVLQSALKLAKSRSVEKAQSAVSAVEIDSLALEELKTLALIHTFCGKETEAEKVWRQICKQEDVTPGCFFMLASAQAGLQLRDDAILNFDRELSLSDSQGNSYFVSATIINLAFLRIRAGRHDEAATVLKRLEDSEGAYVEGVGQFTKMELLKMMA